MSSKEQVYKPSPDISLENIDAVLVKDGARVTEVRLSDGKATYRLYVEHSWSTSEIKISTLEGENAL